MSDGPENRLDGRLGNGQKIECVRVEWRMYGMQLRWERGNCFSYYLFFKVITFVFSIFVDLLTFSE